MLSALATGTPSVTFEAGATGRDVYAKRLAKSGASIHLPLKQLSAVNIIAAIDKVNANPAFRRRAQALAAMMDGLGGPTAAVQVAEATIRRAERRTA